MKKLFGLVATPEAAASTKDRPAKKPASAPKPPPGLYCTPEAQIHKGASFGRPVRLYERVIVGENARVGKYTNVGHGTMIAAKAVVGNYCSISRRVEIGAANHPLDMLSTHSFQYIVLAQALANRVEELQTRVKSDGTP